ncbi:uncharacterized protein K452DRAFT_115978 [Aplosporella prunicola CBS 121167]|uniref:Uncharacterized protein n=1 Tax=Aplosporella prunicola CBS 121167 TaxID=1176127 RepID=A0A6A6B135_9PEZI|nr:uncharacterized protein K452DRAFT_115978 [Aplosporella prunicola CBS 121167]KAF2136965.1 hypothetical protein K452DRAFT_115978 [Aplosporella prunicola CBS 121167]
MAHEAATALSSRVLVTPNSATPVANTPPSPPPLLQAHTRSKTPTRPPPIPHAHKPSHPIPTLLTSLRHRRPQPTPAAGYYSISSRSLICRHPRPAPTAILPPASTLCAICASAWLHSLPVAHRRTLLSVVPGAS